MILTGEKNNTTNQKRQYNKGKDMFTNFHGTFFMLFEEVTFSNCNGPCKYVANSAFILSCDLYMKSFFLQTQ